MTDELKFHKWIHNAHATFFCLEFCPVDFSRRSGDFRFKLVASCKILVAMATKMVATWRVGATCMFQQCPNFFSEICPKLVKKCLKMNVQKFNIWDLFFQVFW